MLAALVLHLFSSQGFFARRGNRGSSQCGLLWPRGAGLGFEPPLLCMLPPGLSQSRRPLGLNVPIRH